MLLKRILLDTNIFILGYLQPSSISGQLLTQLQQTDITLIVSNELIEQVRRVARRVGGKDWAGLVIDQIWRDFHVEYIWISDDEKTLVTTQAIIPREDVGIYLTAVKGQANCMISANRQFVREAAAQQKLFASFYPEDFLDQYFADDNV